MAAAPEDATIKVDGVSTHPAREADRSGISLDEADGDLLVVSEGPNAGTRYELGQRPISVGRSSEAELFFDDVTVSRAHAELSRDERGAVVLRDLGSLNGTYVNRVRVERVVLEAGDEVQIGKFKLLFVPARHR
jgi:pSer/pThr/pTyr-binding forkhead associated (FHA) protein